MFIETQLTKISGRIFVHSLKIIEVQCATLHISIKMKTYDFQHELFFCFLHKLEHFCIQFICLLNHATPHLCSTV